MTYPPTYARISQELRTSRLPNIIFLGRWRCRYRTHIREPNSHNNGLAETRPYNGAVSSGRTLGGVELAEPDEGGRCGACRCGSKHVSVHHHIRNWSKACRDNG